MTYRRLPPLNAVRAFEATARHLSVTRAAGELGVTPGAVSRPVRELERHLRMDLFRRGPTGLTLTGGGEALFAAAGRRSTGSPTGCCSPGAPHGHAGG
jgi:LysR family transcriptional regulator, glycine cleavage system transcriptional activator